MPVTNISPDVDNYFVGAGVVKWQGAGDTAFRDIGNVSKFEFSSTVTRLKHYSSRHGIRVKDRDVVTQVDAALALTMEEFTAKNLALAMLGAETDPTGGVPPYIDILVSHDIEGAFRLVGTNDIGAKVQIDLPSCVITPQGALGFINAGTWGEIQLQAEVNGDPATGSFGRLHWNITAEITDPFGP